MTPALKNLNGNKLLAAKVLVAETFWQRSKGLLGHASLPEDQVMWIQQCNSIHTFFMRFPIDVVFVDRQFKVVALYENLGPWRITFPAWRAQSVFEFPAGAIHKNGIQKGDPLHVGT